MVMLYKCNGLFVYGCERVTLQHLKKSQLINIMSPVVEALLSISTLIFTPWHTGAFISVFVEVGGNSRIAQSPVCPLLRSYKRPRMIAEFYRTWLTLQTHFVQLLLQSDVVSCHAAPPGILAYSFFFFFACSFSAGVDIEASSLLGEHS